MYTIDKDRRMTEHIEINKCRICGGVVKVKPSYPEAVVYHMACLIEAMKHLKKTDESTRSDQSP